MTDASTAEALRAEIARARAALREAVALAAAVWEQPRRVRGEPEAWSPQRAAEHAVSADLAFAAEIALAIGIAAPAAAPPVLPSAGGALAAIAAAAAAADGVLAQVRAEHLPAETLLAGNVGGLMRLAAEHLREHARQVAGVR